MRGLLLLPASLIAFAIAEELQWPHNLPRTARYWPEDEPHVKRGLEVQEKLIWQPPAGVKKMDDDPGQKFWLDYWDFGEQLENNITELRSALRPHTNHDRSIVLFGRSIFGRDFKCPTDTNSCSNIGSDLCCQSDETCVNTGNGVGCCPNGASCGTSVSACDTASGYTSCPNSSNGGCCIPGAHCMDTGCVLYGTRTVTTTLPTRTVTTGTINTSTRNSPGTTPVAAGGGGTTVAVTSGYTTTVTLTPAGSTVTTTIISPTTIIIASSGSVPTCSSDFFSCPASLGGGCCRNGQACASNTECADITTTTSATAAPPVRPTTEAPSSVSAAGTPATTTSIASGCPTGFYMCSAVYLGGCCQVDRDCHTTSCPPTATTNIITSGLTVAVGGTAGTTAACAQGWQSCGANDGGGCCPSGYVCGASCTNTAGGGNQAKQTPGSTATRGVDWSWALVTLVSIVSALRL